MEKFLKSLIVLVFVWAAISCTNSSKEHTEKQAKIEIPNVFNFESQIFETNKKGIKIRQVFILKGNKLYESKNGIIGKLLFVREGNNVFEVGKNGNKWRLAFIIKNENIAFDTKKNGQKNRMAFLKEGNLIYLTDKVGNKLRVVFLIE
jgi:hypothetical protein